MARLFVALFLLISATAARAEDITPADQAAIARVIEDQIAAFRVDDAVGAFGFASPTIRAKFGTPEEFLKMVRAGYFPVYRAQAVTLRDLRSSPHLAVWPAWRSRIPSP